MPKFFEHNLTDIKELKILYRDLKAPFLTSYKKISKALFNSLPSFIIKHYRYLLTIICKSESIKLLNLTDEVKWSEKGYDSLKCMQKKVYGIISTWEKWIDR